MKTFTELIQIPDFEGRLNYLRLHGEVGRETFGYDRYLNQMFYKTPEWERVRRDVILRDKACDLAHPDHEMEYLITVSKTTHDIIHYGYRSNHIPVVTERMPFDMCPWKG